MKGNATALKKVRERLDGKVLQTGKVQLNGADGKPPPKTSFAALCCDINSLIRAGTKTLSGQVPLFYFILDSCLTQSRGWIRTISPVWKSGYHTVTGVVVLSIQM